LNADGVRSIGDAKLALESGSDYLVDNTSQLQDFIDFALDEQNNIGEFRLILEAGGKISQRLRTRLLNLAAQSAENGRPVRVRIQVLVDGVLQEVTDIATVTAR